MVVIGNIVDFCYFWYLVGEIGVVELCGSGCYMVWNCGDIGFCEFVDLICSLGGNVIIEVVICVEVECFV